MTDARFPERWLNDRRIIRLNDATFRAFIESLTWSAANRTDGLIHADDIDLMRWCSPAAAERLVSAGLWEKCPGGPSWRIGEFEDTQTTSRELQVLDNIRRREREKKRRQREKRGSVPGDGPPALERTGQDRPGASTGGGPQADATKPEDPWAASTEETA